MGLWSEAFDAAISRTVDALILSPLRLPMISEWVADRDRITGTVAVEARTANISVRGSIVLRLAGLPDEAGRACRGTGHMKYALRRVALLLSLLGFRHRTIRQNDGTITRHPTDFAI